MQKFLCNSLDIIVSQALNEMKEEQGIDFKAEAVNLVELQRRTGISRAKLRKLKKNNFKVTEHGRKGYTAQKTILSGYTDELDYLLRQGIKSSFILSTTIARFRLFRRINYPKELHLAA